MSTLEVKLESSPRIGFANRQLLAAAVFTTSSIPSERGVIFGLEETANYLAENYQKNDLVLANISEVKPASQMKDEYWEFLSEFLFNEYDESGESVFGAPVFMINAFLESKQ